MNLTLHSNQKNLRVESRPFAGGGEGNLYRILEPRELRSHVVKIYHKAKRSPLHIQKMQYLLQHPPEQLQSGLEYPPIVWPTDLVYSGEELMGFVMPFIKGEKLEMLCTPKLPRKADAAWKRFAFGSPEAMQLRLRLCFNIATAIYQVHSTRRYILVDLKPDNIVIQPNGLVSLVDMDSVEVVEDGDVLFPAPVATPEYTPPEHYHPRSHQSANDISWDNFSMAVIFYKLLLGIHPFAASALPPYDKAVALQDMIQYGLFALSPTKEHLFRVIPPLHRQFNNINRGLKELFLLCFEEGLLQPTARPAAEDWCLHFFNSIEHSEEERERFSTAVFAKTRKLGLKLALPSKVLVLSDYGEDILENVLPKGLSLIREPEPSLALSIPEPEEAELIKAKLVSRSGLYMLLPIFFILLGAFGLYSLFIMPFIAIAMALSMYYYQKISPKYVDWQKKANALFTQLEALAKEGKTLRNDLIKNIPEKLPGTKEVAEEVGIELKKAGQFILNRDPEVIELEQQATASYHEIAIQYWNQAFSHPWVSPLDPQKFSDLFLIYQYFSRNEQQKISELHKNFRLETDSPEYRIQSEAVDKKYDELAGESEEKMNKEIAAYQELAAQDKREYWELVLLDADINSNNFRKLLGESFGQYAQEFNEWLEKNQLNSILQITGFQSVPPFIYLNNAKKISLQGWLTKIPALLDAFKDWKKEIDELNRSYQQVCKDTDAKLALTIEKLETAQERVLLQLQDKADKELHYLRRQLEHSSLQPQIDAVHAEYAELLDFIKNLITQQDREQDRLIEKVQKQYKTLLDICQNRIAEVDNFRKEAADTFRKQIAQLLPPGLQKSLQQYVNNCTAIDNMKVRLGSAQFELKRFKRGRPGFWKWLRGKN